jgi:thiol-disulfide isomerase/thioredoxin
MKKTVLLIIVLAVAGAAGFGLQRAMIDHENQNLTASEAPSGQLSVIGQMRPEFALTDIEGRLRNINEWDGKVLLVNFWATWCPPCKKEIPAFMALQEQYGDQGFQVVGVAIDDEQAVKDYADTLGINYPIMAAQLDSLDIARQYGNRINALPFSAFVDRDGKIVLTRPGELSHEDTEKIIQSLL